VIDRHEMDRRAAILWARSVASDPRAVFIDTETTGLGADAEIIDIAIVACGGSILLNSLVRPKRQIPAEASAIHGIFDRDVRDAPDWSDIAGWIETVLTGTRVIVYNANYDSDMINMTCRRHARAEIARDWECAMLKFAAFSGDPGRFGEYRWHRLEHAVAAFGIEPGGHRALEDANACRNLVLAMAGI
jgi:DNA polymerase III epsilon subunit-like protein